MQSNERVGWIHSSSQCDGELTVFVNSRLEELVHGLTNPAQQQPTIVIFLGRKAKGNALRELFPRNNIGRNRSNASICLRSDVASLHSTTPILFADSDPLRSSDTFYRSDGFTRYPVSWSLSSSNTNPMTAIYARLLSSFADIVCIFAEDFPDLDCIASLLIDWVRLGSASSLPIHVRPRVIIVLSKSGSPTQDLLQSQAFHLRLSQVGRTNVSRNFASVQFVNLAGDSLSQMASHQRLKDVLIKQADEMHEVRRELLCHFSALHTAAFFRHAVEHYALSLDQKFEFLSESRKGNQVSEDLHTYLHTFLELGMRNNVSFEHLAPFIASALLMDSYPPRMHRK